MTDDTQPAAEDAKKPTSREWFDEAEDALERAGEAIRAAWDASRDSRMSALEAAKDAAGQLGAAIDRGVAGARDRWEAARAGEPHEEE